MKPVEAIRHAPLFTNLSEEGIDRFFKKGSLRTFKKNDIVFNQNDTSNELFIVVEGEVQIQLQPETDDISEKHMVTPKFIASLTTGESFGELAVLTKDKRSASAKIVSSKATLFVCERSQFKAFCLSDPKDGLQLVFNISRKISNIVSINNRIILEQYFSNHIALLFRNFLIASGVEKNLLTPREVELEVTDPENFILPDLSKDVEKEILKITLYSDTKVLEILSSDEPPDLGRVISVLLKTIRKNRSVFQQQVIAKVEEKGHARNGSIQIIKDKQPPLTLKWCVKGAFVEESVTKANIHLTLFTENLTPAKALDAHLDYLKLPIQEKVLEQLEPTENISVIVLHHRTMEVVQTLLNLKRLGFTLEAFIGVPYGEIDKTLTHILDYVSEGRYFTLKTQNFMDKKSEFIFDFDASSQQTIEVENELRDRYENLSEKSYIQSMEELSSYILEKVLSVNVLTKKPLVILEDGGYFFPLILQALHDPLHPLHPIVKTATQEKILLGIVEGTASGEVRGLKALQKLPEKYRSILPFLTGARDSIKTSFESKGIASSIIQSSEVAMRNLGIRTFESRKIVVVGGNGAIGTRLIEQLKLLQNTSANLSNVDKNEELYNYVVPEGLKHVESHIDYDPVHRFLLSENDQAISDIRKIPHLKNQPYGRIVVTGCYKKNSPEIIAQLQALKIPFSKQIESDEFLEIHSDKNKILFLSDHTVITYPSLKMAIRQNIDTIMGVTGTSIFDESDLDAFLYRQKENDELVLISGSSKDIEFKPGLSLLNELASPYKPENYSFFKALSIKDLQIFEENPFPEEAKDFENYFTTLNKTIRVRKEISENIGSTYYLDINGVKKRITVLADGMVINFFATYSKGASLDYIDPVLTLQLLGVNHLKKKSLPGGVHRIATAIEPELIDILWSSLDEQMS